MVSRGELRLPEMQRQYVWPGTRVRDLLDSLYRGYPSGTILVWETTHESPTRDLAVQQSQNNFSTQKLLLDGQQRITSLCAVLNGEPVTVRRRKRPIEILFNLDHPDGPPVESTEIEDDIDSPIIEEEEDDTEDDNETNAQNVIQRFNKRTFIISSKQLLALPKWIKVSDVFKGEKSDWMLLKPLGLEPDDEKYEKYTQRLQKLRQIKDYPYVMQVLERDLAYEEVAEIFVRVNSLGVKLKGSDLALAQVTSRWQNSLILFEDFAEKLEASSWFTLDVGLLVRAMVVFATRQSRFKTVQSITLPKMKDAWEKAKEGINFAVNFLKTNAGIEDESLLSSVQLIITIAAYASQKNFELTDQEEKDLLKWTLISNAKGHYSRGSSETILDQDLSRIFQSANLQDLFNLLEQQFGRFAIDPQDLVGRGARSPLFSTAYLALRKKGAKDWISGLGLSLTHQGKLHYIEYHHIFPKSLLSHEGVEKSLINEIANFAFISGRANRRITNKEPIEYLPKIIEERGEQALVDQLIPLDRELWRLENYQKFLEWRREKIAQEINSFLGNTQ